MMTPEQEAECLLADPFQGDFGDQGDRTLRDRMGTARKAGPCSGCSRVVQPGDRVRLLTGRFDGDLRSYRWCPACCAEMAADGHADSDDDEDHPDPRGST